MMIALLKLPQLSLTRQGQKLLMLILTVIVMAFLVAPAFAQSTPVSLEIDPGVIFSSANTWIGVFDDVIAIGIGISIALAILTFLGYQIVKALRGGGGR